MYARLLKPSEIIIINTMKTWMILKIKINQPMKSSIEVVTHSKKLFFIFTLKKVFSINTHVFNKAQRNKIFTNE